jgi:hypothetical protein
VKGSAVYSTLRPLLHQASSSEGQDTHRKTRAIEPGPQNGKTGRQAPAGIPSTFELFLFTELTRDQTRKSHRHFQLHFATRFGFPCYTAPTITQSLLRQSSKFQTLQHFPALHPLPSCFRAFLPPSCLASLWVRLTPPLRRPGPRYCQARATSRSLGQGFTFRLGILTGSGPALHLGLLPAPPISSRPQFD